MIEEKGAHGNLEIVMKLVGTFAVVITSLDVLFFLIKKKSLKRVHCTLSKIFQRCVLFSYLFFKLWSHGL